MDQLKNLRIFGNSIIESYCLKGNDCTWRTDDEKRYFTGYVGRGWE